MDHFAMIFITGLAVAAYVYKLKTNELEKGIAIICIFAIFWLVLYAGVELGRSVTVWFSGKAGDANPLTAILLGGAIAINMPTMRKRKERADEAATGV